MRGAARVSSMRGIRLFRERMAGESELLDGRLIVFCCLGGLHDIWSFEPSGCYVLENTGRAGHVWHLEIRLAEQCHVHACPLFETPLNILLHWCNGREGHRTLSMQKPNASGRSTTLRPPSFPSQSSSGSPKHFRSQHALSASILLAALAHIRNLKHTLNQLPLLGPAVPHKRGHHIQPVGHASAAP